MDVPIADHPDQAAVLQNREMPDLTLVHEGMGLMHRQARRNRHRGHRHHRAPVMATPAQRRERLVYG